MTEKRDQRFTFRLTLKENQELEAAAKLLGCNPSDAVRIGLTSVTIAAKELTNA